MKFYAFLLLSVMLVVGCGSPQPAPVTNAYTQNPYYPGYPISPINPGQSILPPGINRYQIPLYATSGVTFNGSQIQVALGSVNAGDQIVTSGLSALMLYKNCGNSWFSFNTGATVFPLMSPAIAVNGSVIPTSYMGMVVSPAAGTLSLLATAHVNASCGGNFSATWTLMSGYGYGATPVAYINRCYNMGTGAIVPCP